MKRCLCFCLAILMLVGCFAGCDKETEKTPETTEKVEDTLPVLEKQILNVLMIGSSYSYYYCDELAAIARADGLKMEVGNLYISGGTAQQHYEQFSKNQPIYEFVVHGKSGKTTIKPATMQQALQGRPWELITIQESYDPGYNTFYPNADVKTADYVKKTVEELKKRFPDVELAWHQVWSKEVGFKGALVALDADIENCGMDERRQVRTSEKQQADYQVIRDCALQICKDNKLPRIPSGDAWQLARAHEKIGDNLCKEDKTHENEAGQYLNGCVWYEVLTKNSCIGNTFRPEGLSEETVSILQQCAHQAVAGVYGEDYAKPVAR
ncbi:MAG: DUF4886 domain-containing protein [Oscillospiraceae bacterium]|nr:DUF4886 domain-containing protein [Oscillospiraceae bacterium]